MKKDATARGFDPSNPDHDDRVWTIEDLMEEIFGADGGSGPDTDASPRERVDWFFDMVESSSGDEVETVAAPRAAPVQRGAVPTEAPVAVPDHDLIRCLGVGGFGQVWIAWSRVTEHHLACKLIPEEKSLELEGLKRLKRRVPGHSGLFPIESVGSVDGWVYCLMPLAEPATSDHAVLDHSGYEPMTLETYLRRHGPRPGVEVAQVGAALAEAVEHLHTHGVTHGDIKPLNIMRIGGHWALADYGLARELATPTGEGHTPGYSPPDETPGTATSDQYALGVVLMELLTACSARRLDAFRETPIEKFDLDAEGLEVSGVIRRATDPDPEARFGSVGAFARALRAVAEPEAHAPRAGRAWFAAAAVALVLVAAAIAAVVMIPSSPGPGTPAAAPAPDALVGSFEIRHYRFNPETGNTVSVGPLGADNPSVLSRDDVTVHASFTEPAYCYLVSLDTDGRVRPRLPASPTAIPERRDALNYPSDPIEDPEGFLYNLSSGAGVQGFMLLASADPLPAWSDWIATRGEPTWSLENLPSRGVVLFDGEQTRYLSATREPMPPRGPVISDPIDWARSLEGVREVRFMAFPVLPSESEDKDGP